MYVHRSPRLGGYRWGPVHRVPSGCWCSVRLPGISIGFQLVYGSPRGICHRGNLHVARFRSGMMFGLLGFWFLFCCSPMTLFSLHGLPEIVRHLLALLSAWCHHMGLTVSLSKTKWLVGGFCSAKRSNFADLGAGVTLHYWESTL